MNLELGLKFTTWSSNFCIWPLTSKTLRVPLLIWVNEKVSLSLCQCKSEFRKKMDTRLPKWPWSLPTKPAETAIFVHTDALPLAEAVAGPKVHKDLCKRKVPEAECFNNWTMLVLFSNGCTQHLLKCSAAGLKRDENDGDCNDVAICKSTCSFCTFPFYASSKWIWKPSISASSFLPFEL